MWRILTASRNIYDRMQRAVIFHVTVPRPSPSHFHASAVMDKASRALAQPVLLGLSNSYRARADRGEVPYTTLHHRACGRRSMEEKA
jgi:hypothetical protein